MGAKLRHFCSPYRSRPWKGLRKSAFHGTTILIFRPTHALDTTDATTSLYEHNHQIIIVILLQTHRHWFVIDSSLIRQALRRWKGGGHPEDSPFQSLGLDAKWFTQVTCALRLRARASLTRSGDAFVVSSAAIIILWLEVEFDRHISMLSSWVS